MMNPAESQLIADVLKGLRVPPLPEGAAAEKLFALIEFRDADGDPAWAVRVTNGLNDEELLGALTGYVEHLKQNAASSWTDHETTRGPDAPR